MSERYGPGGIDFAEDFKYLPDLPPKFDIPAEFAIPIPPGFKKTSAMGRVEFEAHDTIGRIIGWFYNEQRETDREIAARLNLNKGVARDWRRALGIKARSKSEARRLVIERKMAKAA